MIHLRNYMEKMLDFRYGNEILFGKLRNGGSANVDLLKKDDEFTFKFTPMQKPTKKHLETN